MMPISDMESYLTTYPPAALQLEEEEDAEPYIFSDHGHELHEQMHILELYLLMPRKGKTICIRDYANINIFKYQTGLS